MKNYLLIIIIIICYSCKENKTNQKQNKINKTSDFPKINPNVIAQQIDSMYHPEAMTIKGNRIGGNAEKENYQITIENSKLLDSNLIGNKKDAEKISTIYYKYLTKAIKPFNLEKIIIEIKHRNGKKDSFEFSENEILK
jgi:hypothetical protein